MHQYYRYMAPAIGAYSSLVSSSKNTTRCLHQTQPLTDSLDLDQGSQPILRFQIINPCDFNPVSSFDGTNPYLPRPDHTAWHIGEHNFLQRCPSSLRVLDQAKRPVAIYVILCQVSQKAFLGLILLQILESRVFQYCIAAFL
jgi:hypothetical protein